MKKLLLCYLLFLAYTFTPLFAESENCLALLDLQANPDIVAVLPNESVTFNVLENDIGEGIFIQEITKQPLCGSVEIIDAAIGEIRYIPENGCLLDVINFEYVIEDVEGNTAKAVVKVVINKSGSDLVIGAERDCSNAATTSTAVFSLTVASGVPPIIVSGTLNGIFEEPKTFSTLLAEGSSYEVYVEDAAGNEFSETSNETIACNNFGPLLLLRHIDEIGHCTCNGGLVVDFEGTDLYNDTVESVEGYWLDENENQIDIELGDTIPANHYFLLESINEGWYILNTIENRKTPKGFTSYYCTPQTLPIVTLNESESQTTTCGEPIILSVEGGGEGVTYNWYWDEGGLIPANPPTGQVWTNDELVGTGTVYVVAEGCESEPLAIETTRYEELKVENVAIEVKFPECQEYKVSFTITGGNGNYTVNGIPSLAEYKDNQWRSPAEEYYFEIDDNNQIFSCPVFIAAGSPPSIDCIFVLINDYAVATVGQSTEINVLQNDTGAALFVSDIVVAPTCGEITNINTETGVITYLPFEDTECTEDSFVYEATQVDGYALTATVVISINNGNNDLVVEIERDCTDAGLTGFYTVKVTVSSGFAPYTIFGTVNEILEASGDIISFIVPDGSPFEVGVTDAVGNEFYETGGELTCCELYGEEINLILNESKSQTTTCGESIFLSLEGGEEETTYNWYLDTEGTIPANPPTGQVWTNDELVGIDTIYVIATDTNGCQSQPLAIETTRYEELKVSNIQTVLSESCLEYQVVFDISGGNGEYTANEIPTSAEFRSDWMAESGEDYSFEIDDNNDIFSCPSILIEGEAPNGDCFLSATEDFVTAMAGETIEIDVLQNDMGYNLSISAILQDPTCGTITNINAETGIITYQANSDTDCNTDYFIYEITDHWGDVTQAGVTISIPKENNELVVEIDADCSNSDITGAYVLNLNISSGVPPFTISGSINEVLEDYGQTFVILDADTPYEIQVTDGQGQEFTASNDQPCFNEELCADLQITPSFDCLITQTQDSIALLSYQTTGGDGNYTFNGNPQNDTLQNGDIYQIEVTDGNGCTASIVDTVDCFFTSIENPNLLTPQIHLFPNPNKGNFTLSLESKQAEMVDIEIIDITGQIQAKTRRHLQGSAKFEREDFNLNLESGLYFIRLSGKDWTWTEKVVVE